MATDKIYNFCRDSIQINTFLTYHIKGKSEHNYILIQFEHFYINKIKILSLQFLKQFLLVLKAALTHLELLMYFTEIA